MRILLTGATGFIGSRLAASLSARGHDVVRVSRGPGADLTADFAAVPPRDWWRPRLEGIDAVVNSVGILRESASQPFDAVHDRAPIELFNAAAAAGVRHIVQISALGADEQARSRYHLSKKAADDALRGLPIAASIVQPSLVYGAGGNSAGLFNGLASLPVLAFPRGGDMLVQPVHVDELVAGIVALIEAPPQATRTLAFAGPQAMPLRQYLAQLRSVLGFSRPQVLLPFPEGLFRTAAAVAGAVPGSMLDSDTAGMLLRGNATPANALPALLGRAPRSPREFIAGEQAPGMKRDAALFCTLPLLKVAIALVWIWTGIVSLGLYPVQESYALLARVGLQGALATVALYGAAALDLAVGVLTLAAPARWRPALWGTQLALIGAYTVLISLFLPEYWLHPYGPLSKNLPMMAGIALLWALDRR